ncbi:hypothetical protein C5P32_07520 [Escherichia coli]|jgi:hypothetical protein|nr:hypothetical protein [Escherichia coli]MQI84075.1 hypothetical protein [Escherichia coli]PPY66416.1 hypothetical protein C5P30_17525 [Escherichia coli]PPY88682.1 hypothetical protein C5P32_07520 [Escherichia coli]
MTSLKTSIKTITYLSDIGCLEIQGASLSTINTLKDRDGKRWGNLPDIYCAYLIRCLVFRGELVGYGDLFRMRYSEIKRPVTL